MTTVGVLATSGTVGAGLYQDWLGRAGIDVLAPPAPVQAVVMEAIAAIKGGATGPDVTAALKDAADQLVRRGAQAVVAGCTEVPLGLSEEQVAYPLIDPTTVLARAILERVGFTLAR